MKYEYKINWTDAYDHNLDGVTVRFALDPSVVPYSIPTSLLSERMKNRLAVLCMTVKFEGIHTISYELYEYMPCCFPSLSSLFSLLLLS